MKDRDPRHRPPSPYATPEPAAPSEPPGVFDEVRGIYDDALARAREELDEDRRNPKPLWVNLLGLTGFALAAVAVGLLFYGVYMWPDAPIRWTPNGYMGKTKVPHSQESYDAYLQWQQTLFVLVPTMIVTIAVAMWGGNRKKHSQG